jgi:hypothetical protein
VIRQQQNPLGGFIVLVVLAAVGWFGYHAWAANAAQQPSTQPYSSVRAVAESSPAPSDGTYTGKIADLPQAAQDLLRFEPVNSEVQTNSESIASRVEQGCGNPTSEYLGADDFPGSITVEDAPHGASRIAWTVTKCEGVLGAVAGSHPTFIFQITHDGEHIRTLNQAAYWAAN